MKQSFFIKRWAFISIIIFSCSSRSEKVKPISTSQSVAIADLNHEILQDFNPEDHPLILRRTTLIVRDVEKSLALYRDAMGMEVIYDNVILREQPNGDVQEIKLVFLKAVHNYFGVLGLVDFQYHIKKKDFVPIRRDGFSVQNSILLFQTNNLESKFEKYEIRPV